jgi:hypothetical protein
MHIVPFLIAGAIAIAAIIGQIVTTDRRLRERGERGE